MKQWLDRRLMIKLVIGIVVIAALLIGIYAVGQWIEKQEEKPENRGDPNQRYAYDMMVTWNGADYHRRKDLTVILLMGIDRDSTVQTVGHRNGGQADFLRVIVIDQTNKTIQQIAIDRDTMTPIRVLDVLGNDGRLRTAQICLSHGFGDGKERSCQLTTDAVSRLLCNAPIDFYVSMNLDGISVLNDALGGVEVTLKDDFSHIDPSMKAGTTLTLMSDQAEIYVRQRMSMAVGTNEARMGRQEEYLGKLGQLLRDQSENEAFLQDLYDVLTPYLVTNMGRGRLINEMLLTRSYKLLPTIHPAGEHTIGTSGYMQFMVDQPALEQTMMGLFYEEVK